MARRRRPLSGAAAIGLKVGVVLDRHQMAKHFALTITDDSFRFARRTRAIAAEAALDGLYAVRTSPRQMRRMPYAWQAKGGQPGV